MDIIDEALAADELIEAEPRLRLMRLRASPRPTVIDELWPPLSVTVTVVETLPPSATEPFNGLMPIEKV
ncbi:MAG: hypothetical protein QXK12_08190 [Candidatus Nezhaarchaeales archaeon]